MSEPVVTDAGEKDPRHESARGRNIFGRIALFVRQVVAELRRVVTPTRDELVNYTWIVIGFVAVMILLVFLFDWGFGYLATLVFGG